MNAEVLKLIDQTLTESGINYEFMEWNSNIVYPYFTGEYSEQEPTTEDGMIETTFILNGFTRKTWSGLEQAKDTIIGLFSDLYAILDSDQGVAISYAGSLVIPTEDSELKRIQINLKIKEWRVNN